MRSQPVLLALLLPALFLWACEKNDIGRRCEPDLGNLPPDAVGGEQPVDEIVSVQRNGACESFQCLTHGGYPSYCTRSCTYTSKPEHAKACTEDSDCSKPYHCHDGTCQDDDCPSGFVCSTVQEAGPLKGQLFCVRKEGCDSNFDCEELGEIVCEKLGCLDDTLLDPNASNHLTCVDKASELSFCTCPDGEDECDDDALTCVPPGASSPWAAGTVQQRGVCQRKDATEQ